MYTQWLSYLKLLHDNFSCATWIRYLGQLPTSPKYGNDHTVIRLTGKIVKHVDMILCSGLLISS